MINELTTCSVPMQMASLTLTSSFNGAHTKTAAIHRRGEPMRAPPPPLLLLPKALAMRLEVALCKVACPHEAG